MKQLDVTKTADCVPLVKVFGDPDAWQLICKASHDDGGWMKSTKAMLIPSLGVLVQVSTQQGEHVAESVCFVPGATIRDRQIVAAQG